MADAELIKNSTKEGVLGVDVRPHTQCSHWHSDRDIIAIRHKCCGEYYACIDCHQALATHEAEVWSRAERGVKAVLCGVCRHEMSVAEYLGCENTCPGCGAAFNPGCAKHYGLYFEMDDDRRACASSCPRGFTTPSSLAGTVRDAQIACQSLLDLSTDRDPEVV